MTLAEHVARLAADRAFWLCDAPPDFPEYQRSRFESMRQTRLDQAAAIETEINEAIRALRRHGFLPGPGEIEQPAGAISEGDAAPS